VATKFGKDVATDTRASTKGKIVVVPPCNRSTAENSRNAKEATIQ
jgi:hypothetical protein